MPLALNPALSRDQTDAIVQAVGVQVAPVGTHFHLDGDGERLTRKHNTQAFMQVLYVMVRESGSEALQRRLLPGLLDALKALP